MENLTAKLISAGFTPQPAESNWEETENPQDVPVLWLCGEKYAVVLQGQIIDTNTVLASADPLPAGINAGTFVYRVTAVVAHTKEYAVPTIYNAYADAHKFAWYLQMCGDLYSQVLLDKVNLHTLQTLALPLPMEHGAWKKAAGMQ